MKVITKIIISNDPPNDRGVIWADSKNNVIKVNENGLWITYGGSGGSGDIPPEILAKINATAKKAEETEILLSQKIVIYDKAIEEINNKLASVYNIKGSKTLAQIKALVMTDKNIGDVYNVTTKGVLYEGTAKEIKISKGDNIVWTAEGWDKLAASIDVEDLEEVFVKKNQGAELKGKALVIDDNGFVTAKEVEFDAVKEVEELPEEKENVIYNVETDISKEVYSKGIKLVTANDAKKYQEKNDTNLDLKEGIYDVVEAINKNNENGYDVLFTKEPTGKFVDLELSSGTLWADRNIGALSLGDSGNWYYHDDPKVITPNKEFSTISDISIEEYIQNFIDNFDSGLETSSEEETRTYQINGVTYNITKSPKADIPDEIIEEALSRDTWITKYPERFTSEPLTPRAETNWGTQIMVKRYENINWKYDIAQINGLGRVASFGQCLELLFKTDIFFWDITNEDGTTVFFQVAINPKYYPGDNPDYNWKRIFQEGKYLVLPSSGSSGKYPYNYTNTTYNKTYGATQLGNQSIEYFTNWVTPKWYFATAGVGYGKRLSAEAQGYILNNMRAVYAKCPEFVLHKDNPDVHVTPEQKEKLDNVTNIVANPEDASETDISLKSIKIGDTNYKVSGGDVDIATEEDINDIFS